MKGAEYIRVPVGREGGGSLVPEQFPMPVGQFRPSVFSFPNPYSQRVSETEGKGERETLRQE